MNQEISLVRNSLILFIVVMAITIPIRSWMIDSQGAGKYCGSILSELNTKPFDEDNSIKEMNGEWYCTKYVKECEYKICKVVGVQLVEKVPQDYLKRYRETH